eukprot:1143226-Pelagomonas_calceolata.AAC.2
MRLPLACAVCCTCVSLSNAKCARSAHAHMQQDSSLGGNPYQAWASLSPSERHCASPDPTANPPSLAHTTPRVSSLLHAAAAHRAGGAPVAGAAAPAAATSASRAATPSGRSSPASKMCSSLDRAREILQLRTLDRALEILHANHCFKCVSQVVDCHECAAPWTAHEECCGPLSPGSVSIACACARAMAKAFLKDSPHCMPTGSAAVGYAGHSKERRKRAAGDGSSSVHADDVPAGSRTSLDRWVEGRVGRPLAELLRAESCYRKLRPKC